MNNDVINVIMVTLLEIILCYKNFNVERSSLVPDRLVPNNTHAEHFKFFCAIFRLRLIEK
jgi:hypothetical protein